MEVVGKSFCFANLAPRSHLNRSCRNWVTLPQAKKRELSGNSGTRQAPIFTLRVPRPVLVRSAITVFGLGFIDAGYSGDWSRIGVISKEVEHLLKIAAFLVIPLCIVLVVAISEEEKA
ncbi:hypothetical protein K2173_020876 [Erythroxylum novogranatense]|uniref:DUF7887 domain-containing protein n=1 Tax=Erythroxylum novogranatense TaxID=1862640 RepID=A0AAV8TM01_9ROSI|nr:hypothetical protein K2173_020876 [Erythroxylum novogranatense]